MFYAGECQSAMASGERWQDWVGVAAACPREFPFGTLITLPDGSVWNCQDRGSKIITEGDGTIWIDLLEPTARYPFGHQLDVQVQIP